MFFVLHCINWGQMSLHASRSKAWRCYILIALMIVVLHCSVSSAEPQKTYRHYPESIHKLVRKKLDKLYGRQRSTSVGSWSAWGPWSSCSRSCGTGVAAQQRNCLPKIRHRKSTGNRCIGKDKRFQLCNTQACHGPIVDFRSEQCRSHNKRVFKQKVYSWEPFIDGGDSCTLNCKPIGLNFYATLNQSVIDGTPCSPTNPARICVQGKCMEVGCDGILGSGKVLDVCGVCGGLGNTCPGISGVFVERHLPFGYNIIATLPPRTQNISFQHTRPSNNYLAVRDSGGKFIITPSRTRSPHGRFRAGGVIFTYTGGTRVRGDRLFANGPLRSSVDVMLLYKEPNNGIKYEYAMPLSSGEYGRQPATNHAGLKGPPTRPMQSDGPKKQQKPPSNAPMTNWGLDQSQFVHPYGRQTHGNALHRAWKNPKRNLVQKKSLPALNDARRPNAFSNSPGSGIVNDAATAKHRRRNGGKKGKKQRKGKHRFTWITDGYSACSRTCGTGTQVSLAYCVRKKNKKTHVPIELCSNILPQPHKTRECNTQPCSASWHADEWGPCSVSCGIGIQLRNITCKRNVSASNQINVSQDQCLDAPLMSSAKVCELKACDGTAVWEAEPWSSCSVECGIGIRQRKVFCSSAYGRVSPRKCQGPKLISEEVCDMGSCSSDTWFFSEWEDRCDGPCGEGVYTREVSCSGGPGSHGLCNPRNKPPSSKPCLSPHSIGLCKGKWFTSSWSRCQTSSCKDIGYQYREVLCLAWKPHRYRVLSDDACMTQRPADLQTCNTSCTSKWVMSEWSQCSVSCGGGVQRREIKCLDQNELGECSRDHRPDSRQRCNLHPCHQAKEVPTQNQHIPNELQDSSDQSLNTIYTPSDCLDRMKNCKLVWKARLCKLQYYNKLCCQTCRNT